MNRPNSRRRLLAAGASVAGLALAGVPLARAQGAVATPPQSLGPFYPDRRPDEVDVDLTSVRGGTGVAKGDITIVSGRVLDSRGRPVKDVRVEIWQCNAYGRYHHPLDRSDRPLDPNFQGYGETATEDDGRYAFRTIKPVPYPGRAPHIHFRLSGPGFAPLATQMYVAGEPQNDRDFLLNGIVDPKARASLIVRFEPVAGTRELSAKFDIVLAANGTLQRG
jgi:protocatechuate 3,4-dioxygenase beta subunit